MNVTLKPILHKEEYSGEVERHIVDYFREAVFGPILEQIRAAGVHPDPADQGPRSRLLNAVDDWTAFPMEWNGAGIPRRMMPQIHEDTFDDVVDFLASLGIVSTRGTIDAWRVCPAQEEYSPQKVEQAIERMGSEFRPILLSSDHRILDGHHRWLAARVARPGWPVPCIVFNEEIQPLVSHARSTAGVRMENATSSAVIRALDDGRLWYASGIFSGRLTAELSRELRQMGATFDSSTKTFRLAESKLPDDVKFAASRSASASKALHQSIDATLAAAAENVAAAPAPLSFGAAIPRIIRDLDHQFTRTTDGLENISVEPDLTPAVLKSTDEDFTRNATLYIKDFMREQIPDLRQQVADNLFAGGRADRLAKIVEARFGVSKRKAAFLASQETSLLVSKYREARYTEIGSDQYKWSTSHDERVRPDHALLNGTIQSWSNPPITNRATGAHNNPGEDFNCRCLAIPILRLLAKEMAA